MCRALIEADCNLDHRNNTGDTALADLDSYYKDGVEFDVMSCGLANWCILIRGQVEKNMPWPWNSDLHPKIYSS